MESKTCTRCKESLPANTEYFYKNAQCRFGVEPTCISCRKASNKNNYENNRELRYIQTKKWRQNNPSKCRSYTANYRKRNPSKLKEYYENNKEKILKRNSIASKKRRINNPIKIKERKLLITESLPDNYIANIMKKKVSELPPEVIEMRRAVILLKRELGIGNTITNRRKAQQN